MNSKVKAAISCALRNSSVTRISEASDVSFTSEMNVFDSGGTETRAACGSTMRVSVLRVRDPDRVAGLPLPLRHREDRRADDLGRVAADVERERDDRAGHGSITRPIDGSP